MKPEQYCTIAVLTAHVAVKWLLDTMRPDCLDWTCTAIPIAGLLEDKLQLKTGARDKECAEGKSPGFIEVLCFTS